MDEERLRILKMIEEGVITASEGAELLEAVKDKENASSTENNTKQKSKKYGVKNFVNDAFDKIKNVDFDLSFGDYVEFTHVSESEDTSFQDMDISISNGKLGIKPWKENAVKAEYKVKVYQTDDEAEGRERFMMDGQFQIENNVLRLISPSKKIKTNVTLYVPEKTYDFVKMKLFNGSVKTEQLDLSHLLIKTSNGSIKTENVSGEKCTLETSNGSIHVLEGQFDTCEADTINGSVKLEGDFGKADASAITGSVTCQYSGKRAHTGFFRTTTGSVNITLPDEVKIDGQLRTSIGSLKCDLDNYKILEDKKEVMNKKLHFEAFEMYERPYHLEAETKTGSVTVSSGAKEVL
ncbi:DUF4097 family beta strand repeat-containing protein [Thalassobacillus sp. CUG 92003]|uniref:DUF4097 family beta strand repeat-containing protein n=1 Tax=Thalassobacillus sp. CUG 92003 TaxID=2736641 RepID=UPI0015E7997F|nr:DUF4097 family beta strand repeat-containing protein [Thalassobacillus sp. CUG 92003]